MLAVLRTAAILVLIGSPATHSHVVFEEIGTMAGSVSYLHCAISVNISSIDFMIQNASKGLKEYSGDLLKLYEALEKKTGKLNKYKARDREYYGNITDFFQSSF